jgi:hypothetical protein
MAPLLFLYASRIILIVPVIASTIAALILQCGGGSKKKVWTSLSSTLIPVIKYIFFRTARIRRRLLLANPYGKTLFPTTVWTREKGALPTVRKRRLGKTLNRYNFQRVSNTLRPAE